MASSFLFFLGVSLILLLPLTTGQGISEPPALSPTPAPSSSPVAGLIREACKASRDPATCFTSMSQSDHVPSDATLFVVVQSAVWISSENLNLALSMVNDLLVSAGDNQNLTIAAKHCLEGLIYSVYRTGLTAEGLPRGKLKDARAWMSAAQSNEFGCSSGLSKVNGTSKLNQTVSFLNNLGMLTSNALAMIVNYDIYGEDTESWVFPRTERDGFWEPVVGSGSGFGSSGGVPVGLKADVTVCKEGAGCDYKTVQEAVDAAPSNLVGRRFVIGIKEGVYEETVRVVLAKKNVVFLGDGMGKTVITGSLNVGMPGMTTMDSATVGVVGDGFMASGITFQNTAGPPTFQAVAFRSVADHTVIENCEFLGNQDTLYAHSLRQFYKSNRIQGNVDFIFGNAAAVFQDCLIFICPRQADPEHGENNAVTAHSRNDPSQSTGFVFNNCTVNGTEEYLALYKSKPSVHKNYLGRPWKEYSRTVFINSTLEGLINPEGWMPWDGEFALKTLYYGEIGNKGAGANVTGRVKWSNQIPAEHVIVYSVQNFIQGEDWIPTGSFLTGQ